MLRLTFFILFVLAIGCSHQKSPQVVISEKPGWSNVFDSLAIDKQQLHAGRLVKKFYGANELRFVWLDSARTTPVADSMISFIRNARDYGLNPDDYRLPSVINAIQNLPSSESEAKLDILLTDNFFAIYHHLSNGRINKGSLNMSEISALRDTKPIEALTLAIRNGDVRTELEKQEPKHAQYHQLKKALREGLRIPENVKVENEIEKLVVNMERWRWEKQPVPLRYISVNAPAFKLKVVEDDTTILESKVIVGRRKTPTPELKSVIRSFIIYPYWHVPRSILKEILPNIKADSTYMQRHNYQVIDSEGNVLDTSTFDWASYDEKTFPYILRQREGAENSMGVIKFVFNNNYNVYLHDTNSRGLYSRQNRALSHGCVRVHEAVGLARYLAKDDDTYVGPEDLDQYLEMQFKTTVNVVKPIPVWLQYFTAVVEDGKVYFYDDIYGKDQDMLNALFHFSLHSTESIEDPVL